MSRLEVAFFDCDHTVIDTDCELTWKNMLADMGWVPSVQRAQQERYIGLHARGETPAEEYLEFMLREFVGRTLSEMAALARKNYENYVRGKIFPAAIKEMRLLQSQGTPVVLLSGSIRTVVAPIAEAMRVDDLTCTEPELADGVYTGRIVGEFCIRDGKLKRAVRYCQEHDMNLECAAFYGDSFSDVQIFEKVGHPVVVNPNLKLQALAEQRNWKVVNW